MKKKVVVIGGGIAGLSAAHELIERGFDVEVFEARSVPGGKARSVNVPGSGKQGRKDLPGEHGFRFFPRFYRNLPDTMKRIPIAGKSGTAFDNLIQAARELIARTGESNILASARFPRNLSDLKVMLEDAFQPIGLTQEEKHFAAQRLWQIATTCEGRLVNDYERLGWWEYVEADRFSENYKALFAVGFTRTLVAARAKTASTRVGGLILLQLIYGAITPGSSTDRLLNGPTNDVWINPWLSYLRSKGVNYHLNTSVSEIKCAASGLIDHIVTQCNDETRQVQGDYYICAVPVEVAAKLITEELLIHDSTLRTLQELSSDVAWMNGMQFYLSKNVEIDHGHTMYVNSPWALTSISQLQFWEGFNIADYGDGSVKGIVSIDISNWDALGILEHGPDKVHKSAKQCTREEIKDEVWAQLKASLNKRDQPEVLHDDYLLDWYLDADISPKKFYSKDSLYTDAEPLLVNKINTWDLRPEAHTRIANFFLAADYVKTDVSLATMESANEAARRAVNGIISASKSNAAFCKIYPLKRPWILAPFRWHDKCRYNKGLPWSEHYSFKELCRGAMTQLKRALS